MTDQAKPADDVVLRELNAQLDDLTQVVVKITKLREDNLFRFLSKQSRNELLHSLIEKTGAVDDAAKAAIHSLKKNKRERLPENVADFLLIGRRDLAIVASPTVSGSPAVVDQE